MKNDLGRLCYAFDAVEVLDLASKAKFSMAQLEVLEQWTSKLQKVNCPKLDPNRTLSALKEK